jgi:hypothetical protein
MLNLAGLQTAALALVAGVVIGAAPAWWLTAEYKDNSWGKAVEKQKREALDTLAVETNKVLAAERVASTLKDELEKQNVRAKQDIEASLADNRRLTRELGGLRDPGRRPGSGCTVPANPDSPGVDPDPSTEGRLSAEATEFLLEFAADADRAAQYAMTCHQWVTRPNAGKP